MEQVKRFIEVLIPNTACNLKCHYCYLSQKGISTKQKPKFYYSRETMKNAIKKERLGGMCVFNLCADGETMIEDTTMQFAYDLLEEGHLVNIATNATLTNRFKEIQKWPKDYRDRLLFIIGFHPLELKRLNLLEKTFNNIKMIKEMGCSYFMTLVFCQEYIDHMEEIKTICMERLGVLPQLAKVRDDTSADIHIAIDMNPDEYFNLGINEFKSPLFELEKEYYLKKITSFCYAGDWSLSLNLCTGELRPCYGEPVIENLFRSPEKPLKLCAIGNHCHQPHCFNCPSRFSYGVVPEIKIKGSYSFYRDRTNLHGESTITQAYKLFSDVRLYDINKEYSILKKKYANLKYEADFEGVRNVLFYIERMTPKRVASKIKRTIKNKKDNKK